MSLRADSDALRADLDKANKKIDEFASKTKESNATVARSFEMSHGELRKLGGIAVVAASAIGGIGKEGVAAADRLLNAGMMIAGGFAVGGPVLGVLTAGIEAMSLYRQALAHEEEQAGKLQAVGMKSWERFWKSTVDQIRVLDSETQMPFEKVWDQITTVENRIKGLKELRASGGDIFGLKTSDAALTSAIDNEERLIELLRRKSQYMVAINDLEMTAMERDARRTVQQMQLSLEMPQKELAIKGQIEALEERKVQLQRNGGAYAEHEIETIIHAQNALRILLGGTEELNKNLASIEMGQMASKLLMAGEVAKLNEQWEALTRKFQIAGADMEEFRAVLGPVFDKLKAVAEARRDLKLEAIGEGFTNRVEGIRRGTFGLDSTTLDLEQQLVTLERERARLAATRSETVSQEVQDLDAQIAGTQQLIEATQRAYDLRFIRPLVQSLESGIADAIVDGITTGGQNAQEIWSNIVQSMLRELVGGLVHSGMQALLGGLFGGGGIGLGAGVTPLADP